MTEDDDIPIPEWVVIKLEWSLHPPMMEISPPLVGLRRFADLWDERRELEPFQAKADLIDTIKHLTVKSLHHYGYALDPEGVTFYVSETLAEFIDADEIEEAVTRIEVEDPESGSVYSPTAVETTFTDDIPLDENGMDRLDEGEYQ